MVAHTGIAATLLINGTTVHRQFSIPIGTTEETQCRVAPDSELEKKIREVDAIIWDEACMSDKRVRYFSEDLNKTNEISQGRAIVSCLYRSSSA